MRSHWLEPVSTALCACQHWPKRHGQFAGTKWRTEVRSPAKGSSVPWGHSREGKSAAQFQSEWVSESKTNHVSSFVVKEKQSHFVLGQKKGYLQAFSIQLFLDEPIIVKLSIQKYSF